MRNKIPTKKEESDFVKSLAPHQKEYSIKYKERRPKIVPDFQIVYFSWWEKILRKIIKKGFFDE